MSARTSIRPAALADLRPELVIGAVAALAPLVAAVILAFHSGGYFVTSWGVASIVLLGILVVRVAMGGFSWGGPLGIAALAGWGGLAAWQGLSSLWADQPSAATAAMNQTVLYAAGFALVLTALRTTCDLRRLLHAACIGSAVIVGGALVGRLMPTWVGGDEGGRLAEPISYWNALGAIAAFGALLAIAGAGNPGYARPIRAAYAALVPAFLLALLLTFSRGSVVALVAGLALLLILRPGRIENLVALGVTVAVSVPLLLIANGNEEIATLNTHVPPPDDAGRGLAGVLLLTMLASAAACDLLSLPVRHLRAPHRRIAGIALAVIAVAALATVAIARAPSEGDVAWAKSQFDDFKTYDTGARIGAETVAERLAVASGSGRWQNWSVAVDEFTASPLTGTGAGDYPVRWDQERDVDLYVRNAHSLYLEVLGESGLIGLLLLLTPAIAVAVAVGLALARRVATDVAADLTTALAAGALVAIHMAGDWDWQLPAVTLPAIALGAGALKAAHLSSRPAPPSANVLSRIGVGAIAVVAILLVAGPVASSAALTEARDAAAAGDLPGALQRAEKAHTLDPQDPYALLVTANVLADLGRPRQSDRAFADALRRAPRNWVIFADWSDALRRRGDVAGARLAAVRARTLNPRDPRPKLLLKATRPDRS